MYDNIPIVPNLYEAPSNPQVRDCYYNITLDKYYIYDGTEWWEAKTEAEIAAAGDNFVLKYSTDNGTNFTTETYTDFNALCTKMASSTIRTATDIIITMPPYPAVLIPRSDNTSLDGVALLKLNSLIPRKTDTFELKYSTDGGSNFTTEAYNDFYALGEKVNSPTAMNGVTDIKISMEEVDDENVLDKPQEPSDIFILTYSEDNGVTFQTQKYTDYNSLIDDINSSFLSQATDITISMEKGPNKEGPVDDSNFIVGKIYPKIIFNQKLVENLVMNTNEVNNSIFDGVLTFYKEVPKVSKYRVSFKNPGDTEWTTHEFNDVNEAIEATQRWTENSVPTSAKEVKFEEID